MYAIGGWTVAVQPETQIVVLMFAWVTSVESTPGGSMNGDRSALSVEGATAGDGAAIGSVAHAASSATTDSGQEIGRRPNLFDAREQAALGMCGAVDRDQLQEPSGVFFQ